MHGLLLLWGLAVDDAVPQVSEILQDAPTYVLTHTHTHTNVSVGWSSCACVTFTFSLSRMRPSRGRDIDHWFLQSSKMMMFRTVDSICRTVTGSVLQVHQWTSSLLSVTYRCTNADLTDQFNHHPTGKTYVHLQILKQQCCMSFTIKAFYYEGSHRHLKKPEVLKMTLMILIPTFALLLVGKLFCCLNKLNQHYGRDMYKLSMTKGFRRVKAIWFIYTQSYKEGWWVYDVSTHQWRADTLLNFEKRNTWTGLYQWIGWGVVSQPVLDKNVRADHLTCWIISGCCCMMCRKRSSVAIGVGRFFVERDSCLNR